jgi:hypothetical protein
LKSIGIAPKLNNGWTLKAEIRFNRLNQGERKVAEMFFEVLLSGDSQKRREIKGFILEAFDSIDKNKVKK